jgi:hypothetical protein
MIWSMAPILQRTGLRVLRTQILVSLCWPFFLPAEGYLGGCYKDVVVRLGEKGVEGGNAFVTGLELEIAQAKRIGVAKIVQVVAAKYFVASFGLGPFRFSPTYVEAVAGPIRKGFLGMGIGEVIGSGFESLLHFDCMWFAKVGGLFQAANFINDAGNKWGNFGVRRLGFSWVRAEAAVKVGNVF